MTCSISPMPPILVTLGCAMSIAPASISDWKPNTPAIFSPAAIGMPSAHSRKPAAILRRPDRFLEPGEVVIAQGVRHRARLLTAQAQLTSSMIRAPSAPAAPCGQHRFPCHLMQLDVAIAARAGISRVLARPGRDRRSEAGWNSIEVGAVAAAEQACSGWPGVLAAYVPKRDLDAGKGEHEWPVAAEEMDRGKNVAGHAFDVPASRPITSGATMLSSAALVESIAA